MLSICGCITYACSSQDRGDVTHDPGYAMVSTDSGNISGFRRPPGGPAVSSDPDGYVLQSDLRTIF